MLTRAHVAREHRAYGRSGPPLDAKLVRRAAGVLREMAEDFGKKLRFSYAADKTAEENARALVKAAGSKGVLKDMASEWKTFSVPSSGGVDAVIRAVVRFGDAMFTYRSQHAHKPRPAPAH